MTERDEQLEQLTAYLDGEVTDAERADVERLIARDPHARQLLEALRQTATLVGSLPQSAAPTGLETAIVARLEREALLGGNESRPRRWTMGNWSALAASIGLVIAAGWWIVPRIDQMRGGAAGGNVAVLNQDRVSLASEEKVAVHSAPARIAEDKHRPMAAPAAMKRDVNRAARKVPARNAAAGSDETVVGTPSMAKALTDERLNRIDNDQRHTLNCVPVSEAAEVDQSLNSGRLTPDELANANVSAFTNSIVVEVPNDAAVPVLGRVVEANCSSNFVPNLDSEPRNKPIDRSQLFFSKQGDDADANRRLKATRRDSDHGVSDAAANEGVGSEYRLVMNVRRSQAQEIIAAMQVASVVNGYDTNIDVNGLRFANDADPEVVSGNLRTVVDDDFAAAIGMLDASIASAPPRSDVAERNAWDAKSADDDADDKENASEVRETHVSTPENRATEGDVESKRMKDDRASRAAPDDAKSSAGGTGRRGGAAGRRATSAPSGGDQPDSPAGSAAEGPRRRLFERGRARLNTDLDQESSRAEIVGPIPPEEGADSDIVTCVVTIRPSASRAGSAHMPTTTSHPTMTGSSDTMRRMTPRDTSPRPAASQPTDDDSRG